jgi:hypothetical protein
LLRESTADGTAFFKTGVNLFAEVEEGSLSFSLSLSPFSSSIPHYFLYKELRVLECLFTHFDHIDRLMFGVFYPFSDVINITQHD